jgi:hypothetical protein
VRHALMLLLSITAKLKVKNFAQTTLRLDQ